MTRRDRLEARAAKRAEWAEKAKARHRAACDTAGQIAQRFEHGQPILVGHHSEKRARRDQARMHGQMTKAVEAERLAKVHSSRAHELDRMLDRSVFSDDPDAVERLRERLAENEARRDRMKAINKEIKKGDGWATRIQPPLSPDEVQELGRHARFDSVVGFPPYALTNLGARIRADKRRITELIGP